ncbi:HigA family addiction module antidote protein [Pseudoflavitalea sp. G-6-1-2]|uniref:HigA family addiction module antitoxin n=1 Tax=Pseudoflavitalea sp. G-6-1-2 TaxID=2728841 RepID=UPI001469AE9A|nr:HigA family addiction module antitoxin [Pseudoflavitalea sp. G-6-1-2]NML21523.1 HigA family addiction module antidote protein [Pseudoflavitalea sp. G-6-1-2]
MGSKLPPPHPGSYLFEDVIKEMGLTITAAAATMNISRKQLSEVVNGIASITPEMAVRIERAFGVEAQVWLDLQSRFDVYKVENSGKVDHIQRVPGKKPRIRF